MLSSKVDAVRSQFARHLARDVATLEVHASQPRHFRNRARFAIARFDGVLTYALFDKGWPSVPVRTFPIATAAINALMPRLIDAIDGEASLCTALCAVHFLSPQSGDMLVTLIYGDAVPLDEAWCAAARALKQALGLPALMGRTKGQVVLLDREHVDETYRLADGRQLSYRQMEGSFSNPSAAMCEKTLDFLCGAAAETAAACAAAHAGRAPTLLELYCGNGNHTVALARHFWRVLAVEIDRRLVDAAELNLRENGVRNAHVLCASSGKFCKRLWYHILKTQRAGTQEEDSAPPPPNEAPELAWLREARRRTDVILVDPPRCGLDADTLKLVAAFEHILYISCNPSSLLAGLDASLGATHEVRRWAVFDHFAYTNHLEMGVLLCRRAEDGSTQT